eukprot:GFUD01118069.1.p1 GENE.GFUD01118069.1~~GFUD01118069.1.p1  ORF type:complete len:330 (-),score=92.17 GFUD01118069.1:93-1082(-)
MVKETRFYDVLEVDPDADVATLKMSYRKLARKYHPDKNPDAGDIFKEISMVYDVLSNPDRRRLYDMVGEQGIRGGRTEQTLEPDEGESEEDSEDENAFHSGFFRQSHFFTFTGSFGHFKFSSNFGASHNVESSSESESDLESEFESDSDIESEEDVQKESVIIVESDSDIEAEPDILSEPESGVYSDPYREQNHETHAEVGSESDLESDSDKEYKSKQEFEAGELPPGQNVESDSEMELENEFAKDYQHHHPNQHRNHFPKHHPKHHPYRRPNHHHNQHPKQGPSHHFYHQKTKSESIYISSSSSESDDEIPDHVRMSAKRTCTRQKHY